MAITNDGLIDTRWGRAQRVAIADVQGGAVSGWQEFDVGWHALHDSATESSRHARVARFLRDHDVEAVVAHHMGHDMHQMLERLHLRVRLGAGGDAREAAIAAAQ
ncbi:MAG TPA: NifB/NifX family molybdenum-iron cluster-binding protein [Thermoanaerobaculia bacterium]|nr:NifB/NifX family molybdenum-iron cluster-binding protein [Thermoanaerobaculia bacterium]